MPTTTDTTTSVREGVARLVEWLTRHPTIPLASIGYVDHVDAELELPDCGFDTFTVVADTADALTDPTIDVTDVQGKRVTELTVKGTTPGDSRDRPGLEVLVVTAVYDQPRARLLASLGAPPDPDARVWDVTAEHLRGLVERASAAVGAR